MTMAGDKGQARLGKDGVGGLSSKATLTRCGWQKWWRCSAGSYDVVEVLALAVGMRRAPIAGKRSEIEERCGVLELNSSN